MATIDFPYQGFSKEEFIIKALTWADTQSHFAYFNSNDIPYPKDGFRHILAIGASEKLDYRARSVFDELRAFHQRIEQSDQMNDWLVGYLGYDLKNENAKTRE